MNTSEQPNTDARKAAEEYAEFEHIQVEPQEIIKYSRNALIYRDIKAFLAGFEFSKNLQNNLLIEALEIVKKDMQHVSLQSDADERESLIFKIKDALNQSKAKKDLLRMDYINSLPQPLYVEFGANVTQWPVYEIDVQTGLFRIDVMGKLESHHFGEVTKVMDEEGNYHDPDSFYSDYKPTGSEQVKKTYSLDDMKDSFRAGRALERTEGRSFQNPTNFQAFIDRLNSLKQ